MGNPLLEKTTVVCCASCNCFGYSLSLHQGAPHRSSLTVLGKRSFDDFELSATQGCCFCDMILQSFMMFKYIETGMQVDLLLYPQSPAELHSMSRNDLYDVVEIYACSSKF